MNLSNLPIYIILVSAAGAAAWAAYRCARPYRRNLHRAECLKTQGELSAAADAYLALLETEYARKWKNVARIVHLTDCARALLARTRRREDERRILEHSMRLCLTATRSRSWEKWQRRLEKLDDDPSVHTV